MKRILILVVSFAFMVGSLNAMQQVLRFSKNWRQRAQNRCFHNSKLTHSFGSKRQAITIAGFGAVLLANQDIDKYGEKAESIFNQSKEQEKTPTVEMQKPKKEKITEIEKPYSLPKVKKPRTIQREPGLCEAIQINNAEAVKKFLEEGADPNQDCGLCAVTPLFNARSGEIAELLLAFGTDINTRCRCGNDTALQHAMWENREAEVARVLIQNGIDIHAVNHADRTNLHDLAHSCEGYRGKEELMRSKAQLLFKAGILLTAKRDDGRTARDVAVSNAEFGACKLLLQLIDEELNRKE
jgi:ankyrin repeat protein